MSISVPDARIASVQQPRYLSGPISDFLMLGGSSLLLFPILLALPADSLKGSFGTALFFVGLVLNQPHFAVSYRIFYEGFGSKISPATQPDDVLRYRYLFAGIVAPLLIGAGVVAVALSGSRELLGYGFNAMGFFVGWHYVKQGYGMVMVDAALKRRYLSGVEKKVLLLNAYACWGFAWAWLNRGGDASEWNGVPVTVFDTPDLLVWALGAAMVVSTAAVAVVFGRRALAGTATAWIGLVAYVVSVYLWLVFIEIDPLFALAVPALHSLQYLWVVRRFQTNRHDAEPTKLRWRSQYLRSIALGVSIFFVIPVFLEIVTTLDAAVWGTAPYMFTFIIFINVHHYFLDNVMWRRGNAEVSEHLFA